MLEQEYKKTEAYMLACMQDSAHDREHVYRVLRTCMRIAKAYPEADREILITAALLHDIGREAQFRDPNADHASVGAEMAREYLLENGWKERRAALVAECIRSHRWRGGGQPASIEARILFDSDKLDVTGAIGVARTILYDGHVGAPLYEPEELENEDYRSEESFLTEYRRKLVHVYDRLITPEAKAIAEKRSRAAERFVEALLRECRAED